MRPMRLLKWSLALGGSACLALSAAAYIMMRPESLRSRIEHTIAEHLHLATTLGAVSVSLSPRPMVVGERLQLRLPNQPDLPPILTIDRFSVRVGVMGMLRGHVGVVHVDGLRIAIPPGDARQALLQTSPGLAANGSKVVIDRLISHQAELTILRRNPSHRPLVFAIHDLQMDDLGFERALPFTARLTNPVPQGEVVSHGTIGPWNGHPATLHLTGDYSFTEANLDTIRGIGGILTSEGTYSGTLSSFQVKGRAVTPDFNLDLGGNPVPLATSFTATVNGSNGSTHLDDVHARMFDTMFHVTGDIENLPGPDGFEVTLNASVEHGRIEDALRLVVDKPEPLITGDVALHCAVALPAGRARLRDRLHLNGRFTLTRAQFTGDQLRAKIEQFSRRSQGKDANELPTDRVLTNMAGGFRLGSGVMRLSNLTFQVPGATVALSGDYTLSGGALDLTGSLRMQTSMSKAVGGIKSFFLQPFNWLFRRDGAGAVVPIRVTGTRDKPSFGIRLGAALTRGK